jgi:tetratricopeptide (TPR) repeat protein
MTKTEFFEKTRKIRHYPHYLKYTLFSNEKTKLLRRREFSFVSYTFEELKQKGNRLYKKGKFREALENYMEAYSLLKWIEFKDKSKYNLSKLLREKIPIIDEDIVEEDCNYSNSLDDEFRFSLINILLCISYCYMELRHFSSAIDCLNECVNLSDDNRPDVYLRRSQARSYNKFSDENYLVIALADIQKALSLSGENDEKIYDEHYKIIMNLIKNKKALEKERIKS